MCRILDLKKNTIDPDQNYDPAYSCSRIRMERGLKVHRKSPPLIYHVLLMSVGREIAMVKHQVDHLPDIRLCQTAIAGSILGF